MKCVICHSHFESTAEENAMLFADRIGRTDIPYCSLDCAKADKINWHKGKCREIERIAYHVGPKDPAPTFGVFVTGTVAWDEIDRKSGKAIHKTRTVRVNVGGLMKVLPYTAEMRAQQEKMRGRSTFGEGCTVLVLPSAHFYNARTNQSHLANSRQK